MICDKKISLLKALETVFQKAKKVCVTLYCTPSPPSVTYYLNDSLLYSKLSLIQKSLIFRIKEIGFLMQNFYRAVQNYLGKDRGYYKKARYTKKLDDRIGVGVGLGDSPTGLWK